MIVKCLSFFVLVGRETVICFRMSSELLMILSSTIRKSGKGDDCGLLMFRSVFQKVFASFFVAESESFFQ
jgi:hypothetical protein